MTDGNPVRKTGVAKTPLETKTYEELLTFCVELEQEKNRRLRGELLVAAAKQQVDEELARQKKIQRFVVDALEIDDADELIERTLEAIVEVYECETAYLLLRRGDSSEFEAIAKFGEDASGLRVPAPAQLTDAPKTLLITEACEICRGWSPLGIAVGMVASFIGKSDRVEGAFIAGTSGQRRDTYGETSEAHLSSFAVLVTQAASFRENILLSQENRDHIEELRRSKEQLEDRVQERTAELKALAGSLDRKNRELESLSVKLSKYLSPQVYDSIFSGDREVALETRRKRLTIFFSDIKDFSATTDDLEPEALTFLVNDYLTEMSYIALNHGATIDKFVGDAILAFFGDPNSRGIEGDALACVQMATEMQRRMEDLRAKWTEMGYTRPFRVRIGINTGFCNVGNFGSEMRMDYTVIGGEVNLAARLESICEPDGVMMSHETYALVRDYVDAEPGEPLSVKGIHRRIHPYRLLDIHRSVGQTGRCLRAERPGMRMFLDLGRLNDSTRAEAIQALQEALERLRDEK